MAITTETAASEAPAAEKIPPLENGDRLTRTEFERRYDAMPGLKKAELIKGVVYVPSIDEDDFVAGGPELVAEVAASSVSYDLHDKLDVYRNNRVREYLAWRVLDQAIDWFVLREDRYEPLPLDADGLYKSDVLPGLWLDPAALVRGDLVGAVQALLRGLASPEHASFVTRLQEKSAKAASTTETERHGGT